jgi:hypothetical protein
MEIADDLSICPRFQRIHCCAFVKGDGRTRSRHRRPVGKEQSAKLSLLPHMVTT